MPNTAQHDTLADHISLLIKALLVSGRRGAPAEGRIPFNPLYFHTLRLLHARGATRPSEIAQALSVPRTTISTAVKALQKRGLVQTAADKTDGRAITVALTAEGGEVVDAIRRQDHRNAQAMLEMLDEQERDPFVRMLGKVAHGVSGQADVP